MLAFAAALLLDMVAFWDSAQLNKKWAFFFLAYFLAMTGARIYARDRKIRELYPPPSGSNAGDQA